MLFFYRNMFEYNLLSNLVNPGVFLLFFAGKPAVPAAVTLVCSPMMRGDKVVKNL